MGQAEFARHRGVSKAVVTKWKGQGLLALTDDGKVDVEATEWNLDQRPASYRGGTTHRPIRAQDSNNASHAEARPKPPPQKQEVAPPPRPAPVLDEGDPPPHDPDSPDLPLNEAVRRKENYLGLSRKQIVERDAKRLVDRAAVESLFFESARDLRDAWLSWPARIAIGMADELGIDARTLTTVLTAHVKQHLAELGEPDHLDLSGSQQPPAAVASRTDAPA